MSDDERLWKQVLEGLTVLLNETMPDEGFILFSVRERPAVPHHGKVLSLDMRTNVSDEMVKLVIENYRSGYVVPTHCAPEKIQ
jgi:hypothetical protein